MKVHVRNTEALKLQESFEAVDLGLAFLAAPEGRLYHSLDCRREGLPRALVPWHW